MLNHLDEGSLMLTLLEKGDSMQIAIEQGGNMEENIVAGKKNLTMHIFYLVNKHCARKV